MASPEPILVISAKAGIQLTPLELDSRVNVNDEEIGSRSGLLLKVPEEQS